MEKVPYALMVGSLMYTMLCTKPNIAYTVSVTSRYQSNPGEKHWMAMKHIMKYLRKTKDMVLAYRGGDLRVDGFINSNFQSDVDDRKSTSGFVFVLNGRVVS